MILITSLFSCNNMDMNFDLLSKIMAQQLVIVLKCIEHCHPFFIVWFTVNQKAYDRRQASLISLWSDNLNFVSGSMYDLSVTFFKYLSNSGMNLNSFLGVVRNSFWIQGSPFEYGRISFKSVTILFNTRKLLWISILLPGFVVS